MNRCTSSYEFESRHVLLMLVMVAVVMFGFLGCGGGGGGESSSGTNPSPPPPTILPGPDPLAVNISSIETSGCPVSPDVGPATVRVFLNVLDLEGNQLTDVDLSPADFSVTVDGVAVMPTSVEYEIVDVSESLAVSLISDSSGSLSAEDLVNIESAQVAFIRGLDALDSGEVIKFKAEIEVMQTFTTDKVLLEAATLRDFPRSTGPGSVLYSAIYKGIEDIEARSEVRKAIIAISDGEVFNDTRTSAEVISRAVQSGIPIYTIGLGLTINDQVLETLANQTKGIYYETDVSTALNEIYNSIGVVLVERWVITYPRAPQTNPDVVVVHVANAAGESGSDTETVTLCGP